MLRRLDPTPSSRRGRLPAAWTLAVDAVTVEVTEALGMAGIGCLLLKGPTTATLLYDNPDARAYADSDVLVAPSDQGGAEAVLRDLGFVREWGPLEHAGMTSPPSNPWTRAGLSVDLHVRVPGIGLVPTDAYRVLCESAGTVAVSGVDVPAPSVAARLLHMALHAWHHGPAIPAPLAVLNRAAVRCDAQEWERAATLAARLEAADPFAVGLSLVPEGRAILPLLGLEARPTAAWALQTSGVPMAAGIERLSATRGIGAKLVLIRDEAFPSAGFMRWADPLARRSRRGLAAAYLVRIASMTWRAAPAVRTWRGARRTYRRDG